MIVHSLLRGGPARPARGGVAGRGRAAGRGARAAPAGWTRRLRRSTASASSTSTCNATRAPGSACTCASTCRSWCERCSPRSGCIGASGSRWSRSTRCPTSWCSRRCRCDWSACRCCSICTRRCPSSSAAGSRGASNPIVHRLLMLQERLSVAASTAIDHGQSGDARPAGAASGVPAAKAGVVVNSPSLGRFDIAAHPRRAFREDGRLRLVYTGALTPTYELDVAIAAVARIAAARPDARRRVRGLRPRRHRAGAGRPGGRARHRRPGHLPRPHPDRGRARRRGRRRHRPGPDAPRPFTDMSLSTKVFEYAAMGKPVVASRLPMVERTFPPGTVATYPPGDPAAMAERDPRRSPTTRSPARPPSPTPRRS